MPASTLPAYPIFTLSYLPGMHRCLQIPEILAGVFGSLEDRHLHHVAVVCQSFLEPALDALWGRAWVHLDTVLDCILPLDLVKTSVEKVSICLGSFRQV